MRNRFLWLVIFLGWILFSCGTDNRSDTQYSSVQTEILTQDNVMEPAQQHMVKEGYLSIEVNNLGAIAEFVKGKLKEYGGFVASEGAYEESGRISRNMTVRVPAQHFDSLLSDLEKHALRITNKNISLRDVSEEYVDLDARLTTKRELEQRYRELLKQARTVEEILSIERELASVRAEIESMTARLNFLNNRVSMSILNLEYYQTLSPTHQFASKLGQSAIKGWFAFLSFTIWMASLWPFALLALLLVVLYKQRKRRQSTSG